MEIKYQQLNNKNFSTHSLDDFVRHQQVCECWRKVAGEWKLVPIAFLKRKVMREDKNEQ